MAPDINQSGTHSLNVKTSKNNPGVGTLAILDQETAYTGEMNI